MTDVGLQVSAYQSGVSLLVDKSEVTVVSLLLQTVTTSHSGQYECRPDNAPSATIKLHVIKGNYLISKTNSHWWRNVEAWLSLVESFIVLLRQLSYAIKSQLGLPCT